MSTSTWPSVKSSLVRKRRRASVVVLGDCRAVRCLCAEDLSLYKVYADLSRLRSCKTQHRHAPRSLAVTPTYCPCHLKGKMVHRCWITMCAQGRQIAGSVHPAAPENLVYNHSFILGRAQCCFVTSNIPWVLFFHYGLLLSCIFFSTIEGFDYPTFAN